LSRIGGIVTGMTYVLIPGAGGSAWYWHLVDSELRQRGHDVVVVDLPADDDAAGLPEYTDVVIEAVGERTDLVLVAQSMGAYTAPLVCERLPGSVSLLVLVNPMIPQSGESAGEWWTNTGQPDAQREKDLQEGRPTDAEFDPLTTFFHDMPQRVIDEAGANDRRQSATPFGQPWPLAAWPDVPTRLLTGRDDRLFPAEFQRRVARERLGISPEEMPGGHLSALSHPKELSDRLEAAAAQERTATRRGGRAARGLEVRPRSATRRSREARAPIERVLADLDRMVTVLIKENRELTRQVDRLQKRAAGATSETLERAMRSILRRVSRALDTGASAGRRRRAPVRARQARARRRTTS
jgi:pimeloyl-ACP methyl ester carboxylesterase